MYKLRKIISGDLAIPMLFLLLALWCSLFNVVDSSLSYLYLRPIGNAGWSFIFAAAGSAKAVTIIFDLYKLRKVVVVFCLVLWTVIGVLIVRANVPSPATPCILYFIYHLALRFYQLRTDYKC